MALLVFCIWSKDGQRGMVIFLVAARVGPPIPLLWSISGVSQVAWVGSEDIRERMEEREKIEYSGQD